MEALLIYILKAAGLSTIFLLGYLLLLKNDTSFALNRRFLLGGILASFALPGIQFTRKIIAERTTSPLNLELISSTPQTAIAPSPAIEWWTILGIIYFTGMAVLFVRLLFQIFSVIRVTLRLQKTRKGKFIYCLSTEKIQPFSFFRYIVFNPQLHSSEELRMILTHEETHARQWHSLDVLLVTLQNILLWFNPLNKLYKTSVLQNLEYLADKETAAIAVSRKAYQKAILKTSVAGSRPALANHFYQSFIKKRILMLNNNSAQKPHFWKVSLVLPFIFLFLFTFNVKTEAQTIADASAFGEGNVNVEVSAVISKTSTEADLQRVKRIFQKQNIDLSFDNLKFSEKGNLTNVFVKFEKPNGTSGNVSLSNSEGIDPMEIFASNNETGFRAANSLNSNKGFHNSGFSKVGSKPLYIIGSKKYKAKELFGKHIQVDGEMSIFSAKDAIEMLGEEARDGAVVISDGKVISDFEEALQKIDSEDKRVAQKYIQIEKGHSPAFIELENNPGKKAESKFIPESENLNAVQRGNGTTSISSLQENSPLIVVDGEVKKEEFDVNSIDPNKIKKLNILKGESAIEKYGKRAKNGVIEIDLKSKKEMNEAKTSVMTGNGKNSTVTYRVEKIKFQDDKHADKTIVKLFNENSSETPNPLVIIDGEVMEQNFDMESIDHENIESINVLKGAAATERYGKKAKEGAIEITTKE